MNDETHPRTKDSPDPTKLTIDAVKHATADIEKLFTEKLNGVQQLINEKLEGVKTEFAMRDLALTAAFKSAEAAVNQQNASNTLAIDKAGDSFTKQIDSLDDKIDELKERIAELAGKNWATVGAYIVGALGVAALIVSAVLHTH